MTTNIKPEVGTFRVIRVDGSEEVVRQRATIDRVHAALGVTCCDSVTLVKTPDGFEAVVVMMVDDTGMIDGKPVNAKATELYRCVRRNTPYSIHGDVAIVNDSDFAP